MHEDRLIFTLFGATGDLAKRKLYPAVYRLYKTKKLSQHFALIGTGRSEWTDDYFREIIRESIQEEIDTNKHVEQFLSHCYFLSMDINTPEDYPKLKDLIDQLETKFKIGGNRIYYISLNPMLYPVITKHLDEQGIMNDTGYQRLIIEKPFGFDEASADQLQEQLNCHFDESQIYRIDHYLGKEMLASLHSFRLSNIWSYLWHREYIDHFQISLVEDMGVGTRGSYYDQSGVTKDMIQNHVMQILAILAMDIPKAISSDAIREEKVKVMKHLRPYQSKTAFLSKVIRGQYIENTELNLNGYYEEENIPQDSLTETFFAAKIELDLPQWQDVPFYVRSGKRLEGKYSTIHVVFKSVDDIHPANYLRIELAPEMKIELVINQTVPLTKQIVSAPMTYTYPEELKKAVPTDYERLIYYCMHQYLGHFVHFYETKYAWRFIDHIHHWWEDIGNEDMTYYPALSTGPKEAIHLLNKDNRKWLDINR